MKNRNENRENRMKSQVFSWWLEKKELASLCAAAAFFPNLKTYRQSIRYFCISWAKIR